MIDAYQLREEIIRPALEYLDPIIPYSMAGENLLMGTCAQESKLGTYVKQLGGGPALGIFQMEPATLKDINDNYLQYRIPLRTSVEMLLVPMQTNEQNLVSNLAYATAMSRIHYFRVPDPIPMHDDIEGLANYWKCHYNTKCGKGTVAEFMHNYQRYVA